MLQPIKEYLNLSRIVLASGSPRRQELLKNLVIKLIHFCHLFTKKKYLFKGLNVELCPSKFEENLNPKDFPTFNEFVEETAFQKVLEVSNRLTQENNVPPDIIIGADTIVTLNDKVYGKPKTPQVALQTLTEYDLFLNMKINKIYFHGIYSVNL